MPVGAYESVWLFVGFDLPTLTPEDRKRANRFRQDLLDIGFTKFQLSLYSRYFASKEQAEIISSKVANFVPLNGTVSIFHITDKQFSMIKTFYGGKTKQLYPPEQGLLFD